MIILIDANVLVRNPYCKGLAWRALAHASQAWGLRIVATEVVFAEAVGEYQRQMTKMEIELSKLSKSFKRLGLAQLFDDKSKLIRDSKESYSEELRKALEILEVEIMPVPAIPHMSIVKRAVDRRRPCDENGDGYRDTLNWLTILQMAEDNPDEVFAWITSDSDFTGPDRSKLHPHLIEDLERISASDRVQLYQAIDELVLKIAADRSIEAADSLRSVIDQIQASSVIEYLTGSVLPAAIETSVSPYACGLPIDTSEARLLEVENVRDLKLTRTGPISDDQLIAQFEVTADTVIEIEGSPGPSETDITDSASPDADDNSSITKPLVFRGIITLSARGKPEAAEISGIEAAADDPGRRQWDEARKATEQLRDYYLKVSPNLGAIDSLSSLRILQDVSRNIQLVQGNTGAMQGIFKNLSALQDGINITQAVSNHVRFLQANSEVFHDITNNVRQFQEVARSVQQVRDVGFFQDYIRNVQEAVRSVQQVRDLGIFQDYARNVRLFQDLFKPSNGSTRSDEDSASSDTGESESDKPEEDASPED